MEKLSNIGIFSLAYAPFVGGAELAVKEITDRLPGFEFTCITHRFLPEWPEREKIGNVSLIRLGKGNGLYGRKGKFSYIFRAWRASEALHRERPFQAVWAIMAAYGGLAALLFKLRHPRIPLLLTLQEGDEEGHILRRVGIWYPLWKLLFRRADAVQAISNFLADFARRHGARGPVTVVPNGVDVEKIKDEKSKARITNQNEKIIITTSRLVRKNGIDVLIRAFAELLNHKPSAISYKLLVIGSGPDEIKLKSLARELGVERWIDFLGHVEPAQVPKYLVRADIFARPSRSEGLGNSFLEAMGAGLPIIGTRVGGIPDFLHDGANGFFVAVDDPHNCAEKMKLLMDDEKLRAKLGENGRNLIEREYSWDAIAVRMNEVFSRLCAL